MDDVASLLSDFALNAQIDVLADDPASEVMRLSLLDWAAVGIAGASEPVAGILRAQAAEEGGRGEASVIGSETRVPARMAAWVNGATSHALDYDDTHFAHIGHPSVAVVPAALAVAERVGADMEAFQRACLIGVEASIRVGVWLGRGHYQLGFHQTATAGAFGAALAAGRLLGLSETQMQAALGLVSTRASGLKSQFGTMGKPLNAGIAAQNGVEAALLAARGFESNAAGMDGPQGFGATHHGAGDSEAWYGLGQAWYFTTVQHKFHACCHGLHAALEAIGKRQAGADVSAVTVHTHLRWMRVCNIAKPETGLEAKFSYAMVMAMVLAGRDTARLDSFTDAACVDPDLLRWRDVVHVVEDESLNEMQARVVLARVDGTEEALFHDLDVALPLPERTAKIRSKADSLIGVERAGEIWAALTAEPDLNGFTSVLRSAKG